MSSRETVQPADRAEALLAEQNRKMSASAPAFVRGSTRRFYGWLEDATRAAVPDGPPLWICGDCHLGNLGPVAGADGDLALQIRDLDQTVIGNPAHDLIRLSLSLAMAARSSDLPGVATAQMVEQVTIGYETAFADGADEKTAELPGRMRRTLRRAAGRSWKHLADERIEGTEPRIPLGRRFWPLSGAERDAIDALFAEPEVTALVTAMRGLDAGAALHVLDAAFWRKGCSSLGRLRFAVLVAVGNGGSARHCLIDITEAVTAAAPRAAGAAMPRAGRSRGDRRAGALAPSATLCCRPACWAGRGSYARCRRRIRSSKWTRRAGRSLWRWPVRSPS